ncbi:mannose-6-phosphate isomerase, class I [Peribacillus frigoritolerans]|uniref:mannose-6-phosphate isomerase, class I n=1 Tax=Peribacillus frigoritolerans TaxID=450367 RepID=UPI003B8E69B4
MKHPIFLQPVFKEKIWGGTALRDIFHYKIPSQNTGECWAISAHPNGQSVVSAGEFKGLSLGELWGKYPGIFGRMKQGDFPLLTKILDANNDLSIQVHPNDENANNKETGNQGKTECWYIIHCEEDSEIILGHNAKTKEELINMIENKQWDRLLKRVKIKPGDFFYVPAGTIHSLGKGILVLETQQSSDSTYRVYDYDRVDSNGNLRELHLDKAIDVTIIPHELKESGCIVIKKDEATITKFVESEYFSVYKWEVNGVFSYTQNEKFQLASVIEGTGQIKTSEGTSLIKKGDHFILPFDLGDFEIKGNLELIVSHP